MPACEVGRGTDSCGQVAFPRRAECDGQIERIQVRGNDAHEILGSLAAPGSMAVERRKRMRTGDRNAQERVQVPRSLCPPTVSILPGSLRAMSIMCTSILRGTTGTTDSTLKPSQCFPLGRWLGTSGGSFRVAGWQNFFGLLSVLWSKRRWSAQVERARRDEVRTKRALWSWGQIGSVRQPTRRG